MSRILITGGLGLIGHNVALKLEQMGHVPIIIDNQTSYGSIPEDELAYLMQERKKKLHKSEYHFGDILETSLVEWIINRHEIDTVIHLASFPRQKTVGANPTWASATMSTGLINMLEVSKKYSVKKFLYASSSMVYGDFTDQVREDAVCKPQGQYGIMKLAGELLVKDYARKSDMKYTIIRPSAVYGPLDVEDRVISKFILTAMRGGTLKVNGATETLDFTYVDDAANGIIAATLSDNTNNKTYNITKSHSRSLLDAANLAVQIVGKGTVEVRGKDADFPSRGALCIDAAKNDFGYDPKVDVEEGFQKYYVWLSNSPFWSQKTV